MSLQLPRPSLGSRAPEIDLLDGAGHRWRLSEQMGRTVVVIFHRHIH